MTIDVSSVVGILLTFVIFCLFTYIFPWIASKNPVVGAIIAKLIIPLLVFGAEKWKSDYSGEQKRVWVLEIWDKLKFKVDSDLVRVFLEGACEQLDIAQGKTNKFDISIK